MKDFRVVDLSWRLSPPNPDVGGMGSRRLELHQGYLWAGEYSFDIDLTSHTGSHVEVPYHFVGPAFPGRRGKDISEIPLDVFLGPAYVVDLKDFELRQPVQPAHLEATGAQEGDILLIGNSRHPEPGQKPYLSKEGAAWIAEHGIKMLGMDWTMRYEEYGIQTLQEMHTHLHLLLNDIPLLENLAHFDDLRETHVFFIALPLNIVGLDACPVRAVALEGVL
jgi:arylformamidase